jgi:hypothetical protein
VMSSFLYYLRPLAGLQRDAISSRKPRRHESDIFMHRLTVISFFQTAGSGSASLLFHLRTSFNIILLTFMPKSLTKTTPAI